MRNANKTQNTKNAKRMLLKFNFEVTDTAFLASLSLGHEVQADIPLVFA